MKKINLHFPLRPKPDKFNPPARNLHCSGNNYVFMDVPEHIAMTLPETAEEWQSLLGLWYTRMGTCQPKNSTTGSSSTELSSPSPSGLSPDCGHGEGI